MLKSIYTPLSGAIAQERVMDVLANNLANVNTTGFKGDNVTFKMLEPEPEKRYAEPLPPANFRIRFEDLLPLKGNEVNYVGISGIHRDNSIGPAVSTGNSLDLRIDGEGYFAIHTPEGMRYTRAGDFALNKDGALVTKDGFPVQGEKGSVFVRQRDFEVNARGEVFVQGEMIDRLLIFKFANPDNLERVGGNRYFHGGNPSEVERVDFPDVQQRFLEGSNVSAIKNLTAMILAHRSYEAYQKAIKNYDQMMQRSSNDLGEVRA